MNNWELKKRLDEIDNEVYHLITWGFAGIWLSLFILISLGAIIFIIKNPKEVAMIILPCIVLTMVCIVIGMIKVKIKKRKELI